VSEGGHDMTRRQLAHRVALLGLMIIGFAWASPARAAQSRNCVQFAKLASDIELSGDAWMWWHRAAGEYRRGWVPREGSVLVFKRTKQMRYGHVAVVTAVADRRTAVVDHANWATRRTGKGQVERDVLVVDVSADNDWSEVRVWYRAAASFGRTNPTYGFIYRDG